MANFSGCENCIFIETEGVLVFGFAWSSVVDLFSSAECSNVCFFSIFLLCMFSYLRANYLQGGIPSEIGELVHLTILYDPSHYHRSLPACDFTVLFLLLQGPVKQSVERYNTGLDWKPHSPSLSVSFSGALVVNT
jgi:hypothetical protein